MRGDVSMTVTEIPPVAEKARAGGLFLKSSTRPIAQVDCLYLSFLFPVILSRRRICVPGEFQNNCYVRRYLGGFGEN